MNAHLEAVRTHRWETVGSTIRTVYAMGDADRRGWFVADCCAPETAQRIADAHNAELENLA